MRVAIEKKAPKPKACKNPACRGSFVPQRLGQAVCSPKCALATVEVQKAKEKKSLALAGRRDIKVRKEALKTRADHAKEAQMVMNRYVRLRDAHLGCQWHCSHFRSVGAAAHLRFNLWNMNKSCSQCNAHLSGNIMVYRPRLVEKIGAEKVAWLECNHDLVRHEIPYLKRLKAVFTKKAKRLEARIQCNAA